MIIASHVDLTQAIRPSACRRRRLRSLEPVERFSGRPLHRGPLGAHPRYAGVRRQGVLEAAVTSHDGSPAPSSRRRRRRPLMECAWPPTTSRPFRRSFRRSESPHSGAMRRCEPGPSGSFCAFSEIARSDVETRENAQDIRRKTLEGANSEPRRHSIGGFQECLDFGPCGPPRILGLDCARVPGRNRGHQCLLRINASRSTSRT